MLRAFLVATALAFGALDAHAGAHIYIDGPVAEYLTQPRPTFEKPIARTMSLERVSWNTAASERAVILSDLVGAGFYMLRPDVGATVRADLRLDDPWSEAHTLAAFETIAANRDDARTMFGGKAKKGKEADIGEWVVPQVGSISNTQSLAYIDRQNRLADAASERGDHLGAEIHRSAALNQAIVADAFTPAIGMAQTFASVQAGLAQAAVQQASNQFDGMRRYIGEDLGVVGPEAPEGTHLSVFVLEYFDGKAFALDSRMRVAVLVVLVDAEGQVTKVVEGSDVQTCIGKKCGNRPPKPTAVETESSAWNRELASSFTPKDFKAKGLSFISGAYQETVLLHALRRLSELVR